MENVAILLRSPLMIPAIVLAAGKSTRMGRPKANLPLEGGDTFLSRIVRTFYDAGVPDVVVVVGHDADAIAAALSETGAAARLVLNPDYESGQLSSLVKGLNAVDRPGVSAALVTLVDVPLVTAGTVRAVVDRYRQVHPPIVRPVRGDSHGHPVLIDRSLFDEIRRADPTVGAKAIVRAHSSAAGDVEVDDEGAFHDVDTIGDYERLLGPGSDRTG
jgi:molybdenum cofactor cytidylyltransferase